jgi:hypothetical protein
MLAGLMVLSAGSGIAGTLDGPGWLAQVFPPRQSAPAPVPSPQTTAPVPQPPQPHQPQAVSKVLPFAMILGGDFTKSYVQLGNLRGPTDTQFVIGRGLAGTLALERHIVEVGNGSKALVHLSGLSNPPIVTNEAGEVRLSYVFPSIQFKGYHRDYSSEGDSAIPDVVTEKATLDVYFRPIVDPRGFPTYQSVRVVFAADIKEPEKCRVWFDVIFPVNVCDAVKDYIKQLKPAIENGVRDVLQHPQSRVQFEQAVWPYLRAEILAHAGINPASPTQLQFIHSEMRGTDYAVSYVPRP